MWLSAKSFAAGLPKTHNVTRDDGGGEGGVRRLLPRPVWSCGVSERTQGLPTNELTPTDFAVALCSKHKLRLSI
jgi:hypothetical protein